MSAEILFSVVFVLAGSLVFHISALVSGLNIFRNTPGHLATVTAITIGLLVFLFTPASYLLLRSPSDQQLVNFIASPSAFLPFLLSASGFGLVAGSIAVLRVRSAFLVWFRRKTNIHFVIYSSGQNLWDSFLAPIKRRGRVIVQLENGDEYEGHLTSHSIGDETKAIVIEDYRINHEPKPRPERVLIDGANIQRIRAPKYSHNRHNEASPHYSQAFYALITTIGFLFIALSACCARAYVSSDDFPELSALSPMYTTMGWLFLILALAGLLYAHVTNANDFKSFRASWVFNPLINAASPFVLLLGFLVPYQLLEGWNERVVLSTLTAILVATFAGLAVWSIRGRRRCVTRPVEDTCRRLAALPGAADALTDIYTHANFNQNWDHQKGRLLRVTDRYAGERVLRELEQLTGRHHCGAKPRFLLNEELNFLYHLYILCCSSLERSEPWEETQARWPF